MSQPTLFDQPAQPLRCGTCGEPADPSARLPFEPVSGECLSCNHKTIIEMMSSDAAVRLAAARRHYRSKPPRWLR